MRCLNCQFRITRSQVHRLRNESDQIVERVRRWVYPRDINGDEYLCHSCWELINHSSNEGQERETQQLLGHRNVCVGCGRSILRIRSRLVLRQGLTERDNQISNIISEWIRPRQLSPDDEICMPCYLRARREIERLQRSTGLSAQVLPSTSQDDGTQPPQYQRIEDVEESGPSTSYYYPLPQIVTVQPQDAEEAAPSASEHPVTETLANQSSANPMDQTTSLDQPENVEEVVRSASEHREATSATQIELPTLRRAAATARRCLFFECNDSEKRCVPDGMRRRIIKDYNFYIPKNARICNFHMSANLFHELYTAENAITTFSAAHIEEIVFLLAVDDPKLDFQNPENIEDNLFKYWFGRTKEEFSQILLETPRLNNYKMRSGLCALLCKMRTGDSDERISALFQIPRRTLERYMDEARDILNQDYVPKHLGWAHTSREEFVARNSTLAEHLFGNPEDPVEQRHLIVIADGTYLYTQKSSNYLFQKKTYSLHKYHNLVKPFLIVCCDGYIIDAVGPYPATTNDADIMKDMLSVPGIFTELFRPGDVFILDRGFRDCIDTMTDKGFLVHMPETIATGERQLSTLQANISRCITMNRWVVETVNGRFSRDFKIFREDYFNKRCPHIMQDFCIAAALINHFAVQHGERTNVDEIIQIIDEKIFQNNELAEIVVENNFNMRHSLFQNINYVDVQFPELSESELQLIALGTYQIKQAKSYVGEHLRAHGLYALEVCRDDYPIEGIFNGSHPFILRARIKSRHIRSKSYYAYIAVDRRLEGRSAILGYYCHCPVGTRTVGCCSHVMSILWYLGYARHQSYVAAPASFLDNLLI